MINVTCAIIRNDDEKVLVVQRGEGSDHPLKWEFPGGKVDQGENFEDCIVREIEEELSLDIVICESLQNVEHDYGHKIVRLIPFICDTLMDLPVLNEHVDYRWVNADELRDIDFSEADIPVANDYISRYGTNVQSAEVDTTLSDADLSGIKEMLAGKTGFGAIDLIAETAIANRSIMRVLLDYSRGEDKTLAFRSAYTVQKVSEKEPGVLKNYYTEMIEALPPLINESVIRSYLNIFIAVGVGGFSDREQGILADCCFNWLNEGESAIAIKAYSMEILYQLSEIYPELSIELVASIKRNMEGGSAGVKARGQMILNRLKKG